jgi:phage major head subunit gpT-like protein
VANKSLGAGWDSVDTSWRQISARRSVRDFKAVTIYSLVGNFTYEEVGVTGEIKHKTLSELPYAARIKTFAAMLSITRQDIINDDLGALTQVPRQLGRGAALKLNDVFWGTFLNNAAVFNTTNKNVLAAGAGSALSLTSLAQAMTLFADQIGPDGEPLAATPRILLVPSSLYITARQLMQSTYIAGNTTANTTQLSENVLAGTLTVVTSPYMSNSKYTGFSTTAWYVLASPADIPVVEVQFLNGKQTPTLDQAEADFSHLGIQIRGVHDFGASLMEYRGGVRSPGV